ncbi:MAG: YibE/F family protein [Turicibacter sp.]|nr:YibE/F family protein [Turicibacter sp.]
MQQKKKREKIKDLGLKIAMVIIFIILFISAVWYANDGFRQAEESDQFHETARVVRILSEQTELTESGFIHGTMEVELELLTGDQSGTTVQATYFLNQVTDTPLEENDRVSVRLSIYDHDITSIHIQNLERREAVLAFFALFLVVLAVLGGKRGVMAITSLAFTLVCIVFLLIPLMLKGFPVLPTTFVILAAVTVVSLTFLGGFSSKSVSAMLGCLVGVMATAMLARLGGRVAHISGFHMEEVGLILATTDFPEVQAGGLFISSVLIASLGAVLDTAVTIASTVHELKENNPKISKRRLFKGAMNVGRDTMGTMTSTLILAFAGTSLNMLILIYSMGTSVNQLLNNDFLVIEMLRSITGSLGIILTIPAVALISSLTE